MPEASYFLNISADPENDYSYQNQQGKDLKRSYQHNVKRFGQDLGKQPVSSKKSVDHYFKKFNIDYDKPEVNQDVKNPGNGPHHHLGLSQRNPDHIGPSLFFVIGNVHLFTQLNIADNLADIHSKISDSGDKSYEK